MLVAREECSSSRSKSSAKPTKRKPGKPITSCAECRRSKLKCDGKVPCSTCVLRGCKSICPDVALSARKKYTYILEGTDALHDRIEVLIDRIVSLEKALQELHASHSLLAPHLLSVKTFTGPSQPRGDVTETGQSSSSATHYAESKEKSPAVVVKEELVEAFGTLKLSSSGEYTYFGHTTRADHLKSTNDLTSTSYSSLPDCLLDLGRGILPHPNEEMIIAEITGRLPPPAEAAALCDSFLRHSEYNYGLLLPRRELYEDIISPIYQSCGMYTGDLTILGLLYIVLAMGVAFSPDIYINAVQGHDYFRLALATSKLSSVARLTTLNNMRLLTYIANYQHVARQLGSNHEAWLTASEAMRMAISAGLHVSSEHWGLPPSVLNERHRLFWSVYMTDTIMSINVGRPPSLSPIYIDCPLPTDIADWQRWVINFIVQLHEVTSTTLGARIPLYSEILVLDKKIRDLPIPEELVVPDGHGYGTREIDPGSVFMRHSLPFYKHVGLLLLHKRYFAVALRDPENLRHHKYMPSVTAAFRAASELINNQWANWLNENLRPIVERIDLTWSYVLLAMVMMCQIATKAPASELAVAATQCLQSSEALLVNASATCPFAAENLLLVRAMYQKAAAAVSLYRQSGTVDTRSTSILDEVDRIGGKTHFSVNQVPPRPTVDPAVDWNLNAPPGVGEHENREGRIDRLRTDALERFAQTDAFVDVQNMHPSLVQDMGLIAGHSNARGYDVFQDGPQTMMHSGDFQTYLNTTQEWREPPAPGSHELEAARRRNTSRGDAMFPF